MAKPNLSDAYSVITEFHKSVLDQLDVIEKQRQADAKRDADAIAAILATFPDNAQKGQVYQCAQSMAAQSTYQNYQLQSLRQQYGLDQLPGMTTTPPVASA